MCFLQWPSALAHSQPWFLCTWEVATVKCPKTAGFLRVPRSLAAWVAGEGVILRTLQLLRPVTETLGPRFNYPAHDTTCNGKAAAH